VQDACTAYCFVSRETVSAKGYRDMTFSPGLAMLCDLLLSDYAMDGSVIGFSNRRLVIFFFIFFYLLIFKCFFSLLGGEVF